MKRWIVGACVMAMACGSPAFADVTLNIVPGSSSLTMSGSFSGSTLTPQGTGANVTTYGGSITISTPGASFSFVNSDAIANTSGSWQPLVGGASGSAPANYGMKATVIIQNVNAAGRGMHLGFTGGPLAAMNRPTL